MTTLTAGDGMGLVAIEERFVVRAPVEAVWDHLVDARRVVACVPGGELDEVLDARSFLGRVRAKVGPFPMAFRGRVDLAEVDEPSHRVKIVGQALESAGSSARLTLVSGLAALPGGETLVVAQVEVEIAGRLVELGRGFLEEVGHQLFRDFAGRVVAAVEGDLAARAAGRPEPAPRRQGAVRALPVLLMAFRAWVAAQLRPRAAARREGSLAPPARPAPRGLSPTKDRAVCDQERPPQAS